jgi:hypothetical protein
MNVRLTWQWREEHMMWRNMLSKASFYVVWALYQFTHIEKWLGWRMKNKNKKKKQMEIFSRFQSSPSLFYVPSTDEWASLKISLTNNSEGKAAWWKWFMYCLMNSSNSIEMKTFYVLSKKGFEDSHKRKQLRA